MQKRPRSLTCYICGRDFGTTSLGIHIPQCQKKFINNEQLKPIGQRRQLPSEPNNLQQTLHKAQKGQINDRDIEEFQTKNLEHYNQNVLVPCQNCGRTFQDDRLVVHLRSCKPKPNMNQQSKNQQQNRQSQYPQQKEMSKPKTLVCYICGREYGTQSLKIHIPQCQKKFMNNENMKPKHQRKGLPEPPVDLMRFINGETMSRNDMDEYNKSAADKYNNDVMEQCPNCGRTFLEDRLVVHLRSCKADNPSKKRSIDDQGQNHNNQSRQVNQQTFGRQQQQQFQIDDGGDSNMNLVPCRICNRKFNSDRIDQHQRICQKAQQKDQKRHKMMDLKNKKKEMQMKSILRNEKKYDNKLKSDIKAKPKWKQQHEDFINNMKYMRQVNAAEQKGMDIKHIQPPQQQNTNQDYVGCPHCGRKFNEQVAERHIPKCKNIINKPKPVPKRNEQMRPPPSQKQQSSQKQSNQRQSQNQSNINVNYQNTNYAINQQVKIEQYNQQSIRNQNTFGSNHVQSQIGQQMSNGLKPTLTQQKNQLNTQQRQVVPNQQRQVVPNQQRQSSTNQQRQPSTNQQRQPPPNQQRMNSNNVKAREQQNQGVFGQQKGYKFKY